MMKILIGDILKSEAQTLVNTVNCVGVMGKGIALEFKRRFPEMYEDYVNRCNRKEVRVGVPYLFKTLLPPQIINFPTKTDWRAFSSISDIENGLDYLVNHYREWGVTSLAVPPLGCGSGQLEWEEVGPVMYDRLKTMDIPIELYAPYGTPPKQLSVDFLSRHTGRAVSSGDKQVSPKLNPAWVALIEILHRIEEQPYHHPVGRTIFQKIAYVATEQGLPTGLYYSRGSFGPFAKDLKKVTVKLANSNLLQERQVNRMIVVTTGSNYSRVRKRFETQLARWELILEKTTDLFMRLNTRQAELVATVLFVANELRDRKPELSEKDVLEDVMKWKLMRKPPLEEPDVASTIRHLGMLHWCKLAPSRDLPIVEEELVGV
jgi:O-acetyl-ADP-ribose deacetylase (regulator of RNase III)/uncharacterized protein YwgA